MCLHGHHGKGNSETDLVVNLDLDMISAELLKLDSAEEVDVGGVGGEIREGEGHLRLSDGLVLLGIVDQAFLHKASAAAAPTGPETKFEEADRKSRGGNRPKNADQGLLSADLRPDILAEECRLEIGKNRSGSHRIPILSAGPPFGKGPILLDGVSRRGVEQEDAPASGMIDLDHNATTHLCSEAREAMTEFLEGRCGNPSSVHAQGRRSRAAIDEARDSLAGLLGAKPGEIIFTSGGTESCNLAILGLARRHRSAERFHIVTAATEHHAVLHSARWLSEREGFTLTEVPVDSQGRIDPEVFLSTLRPETILASVMIANNETGVIQPVANLAALCRERGIFFHTDAVQAFGKIPCLPGDLGVDALSVAAHKFHGPVGAGFLWLKSGVSLEPVFHGGYHEGRRRAGTENAAAIAGMAAAARLAAETVSDPATASAVAGLRDLLWNGIRALDGTAVRNAGSAIVLANTLSVSFPGCDGETLLMGLDLEGVAASSGSACMVGGMMASHVLMAMGVSESLARATVRFSLGKETTREEILAATKALGRVLARQSRQ